MSVKEFFRKEKDWLVVADLQKKEAKVTISEVGIVEFDSGNKLLIGFEGKEKKLVCNKTNAGRIAAVYGDEEQAWVGREIIMYPDVTDFQGTLKDCIRVRIESEVVDDSEVPF